MRLDDSDKAMIEGRIAGFEQATGAQAVISVVDRCDSYPEIPWRAFALGAVLAALLLWAVPIAGALFYHSTTLLLAFVLATGIVASLLSLVLPLVGRSLLPRERREAEVQQYAEAMFLKREMFATRERSAVLILVALYERCAVLHVDCGLRERLGSERLEDLEKNLNADLGSKGLASAVQGVLATLETTLRQSGLPAAGNEIPDSVVREQGH